MRRRTHSREQNKQTNKVSASASTASFTQTESRCFDLELTPPASSMRDRMQDGAIVGVLPDHRIFALDRSASRVVPRVGLDISPVGPNHEAEARPAEADQGAILADEASQVGVARGRRRHQHGLGPRSVGRIAPCHAGRERGPGVGPGALLVVRAAQAACAVVAAGAGRSALATGRLGEIRSVEHDKLAGRRPGDRRLVGKHRGDHFLSSKLVRARGVGLVGDGVDDL